MWPSILGNIRLKLPLHGVESVSNHNSQLLVSVVLATAASHHELIPRDCHIDLHLEEIALCMAAMRGLYDYPATLNAIEKLTELLPPIVNCCGNRGACVEAMVRNPERHRHA